MDPYPPIGDYALIGDCHSVALVSRDASIDWCCFHRVDARPVFARLLDHDRGGWFRLGPGSDARVTRRYLPGTNVLETRFETSDGVLHVTDAFAVGETSRDHVVRPHHELVRIARCVEGNLEVHAEFHPRFDYGLTQPHLDLADAHTGLVYGGADALVLRCSEPLRTTGPGGCVASARLRSGDVMTCSLTYRQPHTLGDGGDASDARAWMDSTIAFWTGWSERIRYDGPYRDEVLRSALVLKALTNAPTGAIAAAPTTSLPESIGGVRNWDYRYTWIRDATLIVDALFSLGAEGEGHAFMDWLRRTTAGTASDLQIMYGVGGERMLHEVDLTFLDGYRGSKPVRIGNGAWDQEQLDMYGELLDCTWRYHRHGGEIDEVFWGFLHEVVDHVAERWREPDHGIWEVREEPSHFVSSKVMAWVAFDRAIKLARERGLDADVRRWERIRDDIRARIEREGVRDGVFVRSFGAQTVDASALLIPLVGFLPATDERVAATVRRVEQELGRDGLVHRYREPDGLPGGEGCFLACSFWLAGAYAQMGDPEHARQVFEHTAGFANDLGLLSEQADPETGELLGNFPQAFSHLALIGAANAIKEAERRRSDRHPGASARARSQAG